MVLTYSPVIFCCAVQLRALGTTLPKVCATSSSSNDFGGHLQKTSRQRCGTLRASRCVVLLQLLLPHMFISLPALAEGSSDGTDVHACALHAIVDTIDRPLTIQNEAFFALTVRHTLLVNTSSASDVQGAPHLVSTLMCSPKASHSRATFSVSSRATWPASVSSILNLHEIFLAKC